MVGKERNHSDRNSIQVKSPASVASANVAAVGVSGANKSSKKWYKEFLKRCHSCCANGNGNNPQCCTFEGFRRVSIAVGETESTSSRVFSNINVCRGISANGCWLDGLRTMNWLIEQKNSDIETHKVFFFDGYVGCFKISIMIERQLYSFGRNESVNQAISAIKNSKLNVPKFLNWQKVFTQRHTKLQYRCDLQEQPRRHHKFYLFDRTLDPKKRRKEPRQVWRLFHQ